MRESEPDYGVRWDQDHRSSDLIDRRGSGPASRSGGGGGSGLLSTLLPMVLRSRFGMAGAAVLLVGYGALQFFGGGGSSQRAANLADDSSSVAPNDEGGAFVGFVLDDIQDSWARAKPDYARAKLVLFTRSTDTACGFGDAATGPFYCPADQRVYIDLSFYEQLRQRLGAGGDFAQAYVIAHEIGHHLQTLDGTSGRVHRAPKRDQKGPGGMLVRLELQADCYAGVWAHDANARQLLEVGDIDEALTAAAAIGDDRLQEMAGAAVTPESFTHGSSEQRMRWFRRGYDSGDATRCDTFSGGL